MDLRDKQMHIINSHSYSLCHNVTLKLQNTFREWQTKLNHINSNLSKQSLVLAMPVFGLCWDLQSLKSALGRWDAVMPKTSLQPGAPCEHSCPCLFPGESLPLRHLQDCSESQRKWALPKSLDVFSCHPFSLCPDHQSHPIRCPPTEECLPGFVRLFYPKAPPSDWTAWGGADSTECSAVRAGLVYYNLQIVYCRIMLI